MVGGLGGDEEPVGDLGVGEPAGHQLGDVELTVGQARRVGAGAGPGPDAAPGSRPPGAASAGSGRPWRSRPSRSSCSTPAARCVGSGGVGARPAPRRTTAPTWRHHAAASSCWPVEGEPVRLRDAAGGRRSTRCPSRAQPHGEVARAPTPSPASRRAGTASTGPRAGHPVVGDPGQPHPLGERRQDRQPPQGLVELVGELPGGLEVAGPRCRPGAAWTRPVTRCGQKVASGIPSRSSASSASSSAARQRPSSSRSRERTPVCQWLQIGMSRSTVNAQRLLQRRARRRRSRRCSTSR